MNPFFAIILTALVLEFALGLVADVLNLRALAAQAPAGLEDVYDPGEYRRSQKYTRANTRLGILSGSFKLLLLLGFWFSGGFNYLDQAVRGWSSITILSGLLYIGILALASTLLSQPFAIYRTFVIEERFGFNKTGPGTFAMDRIKGLGLALVLGAPLLAAILAFFQYAGPLAWLYCWLAVTLFTLALQFIAPMWVMPLFNKFTPMEPGELKRAIIEYARSVDFTLSNIYVMDGSKRSSHSNAFFTGFGRSRRIALFDTLIERQTTPEVVAVLAHEIGHYKKRHILQNMVIGTLHAGLLFFLLSVFLNSTGLHDAFYMEELSIYAGLLFFALLYTPIELVISTAMQMVSRRHEYEADRWAAATIEDPQALVAGLKKLAADNLSNLAPHPFYAFLNYSHPPLPHRVEAVQREAAR